MPGRIIPGHACLDSLFSFPFPDRKSPVQACRDQKESQSAGSSRRSSSRLPDAEPGKTQGQAVGQTVEEPGHPDVARALHGKAQKQSHAEGIDPLDQLPMIKAETGRRRKDRQKRRKPSPKARIYKAPEDELLRKRGKSCKEQKKKGKGDLIIDGLHGRYGI